MRDAVAHLNWYAVLLATAVYFMLGVPWFSPATLGPAWERAQGFAPSEGYSPAPLLYLGPLLGCFAGALATAVLARATRATTPADAIALGLTVALGFSVPVAFLDAIAPAHPDPRTLLAITGSYHLVGLVVVSLIVTRWRGSAYA